MNISIIGSGYVGLGTAAGLMNNGHRVKCIDNDRTKVDLINSGRSPIYEEGLDELLSEYINLSGNSLAYTNYQVILETDITFICVGTPSKPDGSIDLTCIENAVDEMGRLLVRKQGFHVIVVKSTVVPGTTQRLIIPLLEKLSGKKVGQDIGAAVNPEFLQEGAVLHCARNPLRIVIGASDEQTANAVEGLYENFSIPIVRTDITTAEMIKYASNTYLATRLSFINEIGNICKTLNVDVSEVARGMGHDPRIGNGFLNAGIGFGGSCLPKDVEALIYRARELGCESELLKSVSKVNQEQPKKLIEIARKRLGSFEGKSIAIMGMAFKPNTNDIRQAPALTIITQLLNEKATIVAYDPQAMPEVRQVFADDVKLCDSAQDAIDQADCVLIITEWDEFKDETLYIGKIVIDGRRALDPQKAKALCDYEGICW